MTYEAWRISYQSSEQAARAAYEECHKLRAALQQEADCVEAAKAEIDALRTRVEAMEKQEPVAWLHESRRDSDVVTNAVKHVWGKAAVGSMAAYSIPLYALPGAQPAPSIPNDVMRDAKRYRFLRAAKNIPISTEAARDPIVYDAAIDAAMLAAAPEAKP